ncbi:MAG: ribosomal protein S18-alanine N-acetyltransferase [Solobacterium sp.]|nr:ribosomal protein S18-alanine N-acetyltransferase [Solobacterium sp.]
MEIEAACFPESPWPLQEFLYELNENPFSHLEVEEEDGIIAGYIDWWILYDHAQLANIAVDPAFRGRGIAKRMMDACIKDAVEQYCETLSLEVRVSNEPAIALYHSYGFIDAAVRRRYYEDGEDAILMVLPLEVNDDTDTCD